MILGLTCQSVKVSLGSTLNPTLLPDVLVGANIESTAVPYIREYIIETL